MGVLVHVPPQAGCACTQKGFAMGIRGLGEGRPRCRVSGQGCKCRGGCSSVCIVGRRIQAQVGLVGFNSLSGVSRRITLHHTLTTSRDLHFLKSLTGPPDGGSENWWRTCRPMIARAALCEVCCDPEQINARIQWGTPTTLRTTGRESAGSLQVWSVPIGVLSLLTTGADRGVRNSRS